MEKENLIIEAASLVHKDWCIQELEGFYNRAKKNYEEGSINKGQALRAACFKGNTKRNEIFIDVPFMTSLGNIADRCFESFEAFMNLVNIGAINIKRFTPRNLTDQEIKEKASKGDYDIATKSENILVDFKYLSTDSKKENLEAAISAYSVFEDLSKAGISIEQMQNDQQIRNLIGIGIHTDWMKRNPNHPNEDLKVAYSELDDWTKQQDLTIFDALLKVVKEHNFAIIKSSEITSIPDYLEEEKKALKIKKR